MSDNLWAADFSVQHSFHLYAISRVTTIYVTGLAFASAPGLISVTVDLLDKMAAAEIHADVMGSDHCPISLTLDV